jgi:protein-S-isoprenylcysteine O-methyltransferase Ste14
MADEQDNPGGWVPPPLTYLPILLLGLVLERSLHLPFLPHRVARVLRWPLVGGGMALARWFIRTMGGADTTLEVNKPVSRELSRTLRCATLATPPTSLSVCVWR